MSAWDEDKRQTNLAKHDVDFADAAGFDWPAATERPDNRHDYGEVRIEATGLIGDRLHVLVYTRRENALRIISLRKANPREVERWLT